MAHPKSPLSEKQLPPIVPTPPIPPAHALHKAKPPAAHSARKHGSTPATFANHSSACGTRLPDSPATHSPQRTYVTHRIPHDATHVRHPHFPSRHVHHCPWGRKAPNS